MQYFLTNFDHFFFIQNLDSVGKELVKKEKNIDEILNYFQIFISILLRFY